MMPLRIATRKSPLALWQAEHVKQQLQNIHAHLDIELVSLTTAGDRLLKEPLFAFGGKGLFIKELEQAILDHRADIAIHSMKDVTVEIPRELELSVILKRGDTHDAFLSNRYDNLADLPKAAIVGTSSLRRQSQLLALRPDLCIESLRGNVGTRLQKLDAGEYDAIILAVAGIKRLGMFDRVKKVIAHEYILPAIGQGAIGIECRANDKKVLQLIRPLNDPETALCVNTERAFSARLYGGCQLPIAGHAFLNKDKIRLTGLVSRLDGSEILKSDYTGHISEAEKIGGLLADRLISKGADRILAGIRC